MISSIVDKVYNLHIKLLVEYKNLNYTEYAPRVELLSQRDVGAELLRKAALDSLEELNGYAESSRIFCIMSRSTSVWCDSKSLVKWKFAKAFPTSAVATKDDRNGAVSFTKLAESL